MLPKNSSGLAARSVYPCQGSNSSEKGCCELGQGQEVSSKNDMDNRLLMKFLIKNEVASIMRLHNTFVLPMAYFEGTS
jgi:hypothetical protein